MLMIVAKAELTKRFLVLNSYFRKWFLKVRINAKKYQ